ncbi:lytic transglycosylase domain-containing protein [Fibrobacter succinogenes]|uniref:lytic transglycosylase domain-containing protein n=1 Tax=Fibrobacter succinogenes TaxID=833 RepID=UPI0015691A37|nr:transglycosylase SLT domain-containing protein [Fibrobacter succinogenes]
MKSSVRLSSMAVSVLFVIGFAVLFTFASEWYSNRLKLENLAYRERILHNDLEHLEVVGKWTLDYVKIEKALTYMLGDRLPEVSFRILAENLWQISQSYSLDPLIILAVVAQESRGNPLARGRFQTGKFSGALGLMQIKLETAKSMGSRFGLVIETEEDLMRPEVNVVVGSAYLIRLIGKYGHLREALVAYNLGHSAVDKLLEKNAPLPTVYYEGVVAKYKDLVAHCSF